MMNEDLRCVLPRFDRLKITKNYLPFALFDGAEFVAAAGALAFVSAAAAEFETKFASGGATSVFAFASAVLAFAAVSD
jgi:hypothetical protein